MIPDDIQKTTKFGYEGYFLRFINYNRENPEHALPVIHGIYPNMARVANVNTVTEEFYLEDEEAAVHIQLSQQNLLKAEVFVREQTEEGEEWIPWRQSSRSVENGRSCQLDMASGELFFRKHQFSGFRLAEEGPHIRVLHSNYSGSVANVPAGAITIPGTAHPVSVRGNKSISGLWRLRWIYGRDSHASGIRHASYQKQGSYQKGFCRADCAGILWESGK